MELQALLEQRELLVPRVLQVQQEPMVR